MFNSLSIRFHWRDLNKLTRLFIEIAALISVLISVSVIVLRYVLLPSIEQYHSVIVDSLSTAVGYPVTLGRINGSWQGFQPHITLNDVRILNENAQPALVFSKIDASIAWWSLLVGDIRLANLEISKPELLVRRDEQGGFYFGDLMVSGQSSDNTLSEWLLKQSRIVVRDALIVWVDEQRGAPPLVMQKVNLRVENFFNRHSFALHAVPPDELSTSLDFRGDFSGPDVNDWTSWRGQVYTRLDYTDVADWRPWLDLPAGFKQGRGALRGWIGFENGKASKIVADLDLRDLVTNLSGDVPEMVVSKLRGRVLWNGFRDGLEVSTRELSVVMQDGLQFNPTDLYFRATSGASHQEFSYQIRVNFLQLEDAASLMKFAPLDSNLQKSIEAYSPRGKVTGLNVRWKSTPDGNDKFTIRGKFEDVALQQVGKAPGFSGFTGDIDGNEEKGRLNITSHQLRVDAPGIMREELFFSILTGQVRWRNEKENITVNVDNVTVANSDLAGNMYGSYSWQAGTTGMLDLTARLTRGDISRAARYTPLIALHQDGNDWLNGALLAGHTEDLRIRIKGNLSDFPIRDESQGVLFKIGGHARDGVLEFAKDWPRIEDINGEFLIKGSKMEVIVPTATMAGARLHNVVVSLPDMTSSNLALKVNGEADAENDTFLKFIRQSPVRGYINGFTDNVHATGSGHLTLFLSIPLGGGVDDEGVVATEKVEVRVAKMLEVNTVSDETLDVAEKPRVQVSGNFHVRGSDIDLGPGIPWLRDTSGVLMFTESGMQAQRVSARILGGAALLDVQTGVGDTVHANVSGKSNVDYWRKNNPHPVLNYLSGGASWDADIRLVNKQAQVMFNSDLMGLGSRLPAPFDKHAEKAIPLHLEKTIIAEDQDLIAVNFGKVLSARLERTQKNGEMSFKRGILHFGKAEEALDYTKKGKRSRSKTGLWITGDVPVLSMEGWGDIFSSSSKSGATFPIAGINLSVGEVAGYGKTIGSVRIKGSKLKDGLTLNFTGDSLSGKLSWLPKGYNKGGQISLQLSNLDLSEDSHAVKTPKPVYERKFSEKTVQKDMQPSNLPAVEISVERLQLKGSPVGRFELVGYPEGADWLLRRLNITNPDGKLSGDGAWRVVTGGTQSEAKFQLSINDAGNTLARYGYPDTVKGGTGILSANMYWEGAPGQFKYSSLNGMLKLDTGKGRFLKMDPGAGKLLSVLSLQALPKHLFGDFDDVFSAGFQFDKINGSATINQGVIDTQDLAIEGTAAKVTMKGNIDMNSETQNMRVRVLPAVGAGVSLIGAFAAGPAVGVGALIVNKVLGDPLDKLVSFEYNVDGAWSNPNVVKIARPQAKLPE